MPITLHKQHMCAYLLESITFAPLYNIKPLLVPGTAECVQKPENMFFQSFLRYWSLYTFVNGTVYALVFVFNYKSCSMCVAHACSCLTVMNRERQIQWESFFQQQLGNSFRL